MPATAVETPVAVDAKAVELELVVPDVAGTVGGLPDGEETGPTGDDVGVVDA